MIWRLEGAVEAWCLRVGPWRSVLGLIGTGSGEWAGASQRLLTSWAGLGALDGGKGQFSSRGPSSCPQNHRRVPQGVEAMGSQQGPEGLDGGEEQVPSLVHGEAGQEGGMLQIFRTPSGLL